MVIRMKTGFEILEQWSGAAPQAAFSAQHKFQCRSQGGHMEQALIAPQVEQGLTARFQRKQ